MSDELNDKLEVVDVVDGGDQAEGDLVEKGVDHVNGEVDAQTELPDPKKDDTDKEEDQDEVLEGDQSEKKKSNENEESKENVEEATDKEDEEIQFGSVEERDGELTEAIGEDLPEVNTETMVLREELKTEASEAIGADMEEVLEEVSHIETTLMEVEINEETNGDAADNINVSNTASDDDFDDFDDFNEFQESSPPAFAFSGTDNSGTFPQPLFSNASAYRAKLDQVLLSVFGELAVGTGSEPSKLASLLDDRSRQVFQEISRVPRLSPPNWLRLNIRHNLLINLGIPINLDEVATAPGHGLFDIKPSLQVDWQGMPIPNPESLGEELIAQLINNTPDTLARIETDNLTNSSVQFLENAPDEVIDAKLHLFRDNYQELLKLAGVWQHQLENVTENTEIYGEVVQSVMGYQHKKRREELLEEKMKKKP